MNKELVTLQIGEEEAEKIMSMIYDYSGYDFSNYSAPSLVRRFQRYVDLKKINDLDELFDPLKNNSKLLNDFIEEITVNVTEMFRDPYFFHIVRQKVLPELKNISPLKIWHAGCSTGEEAYSMAIVLKEYGILENCIIYATDINQSVLETARKGIYSLDDIKQYANNYKASESKGNFNDYYEIKNGQAHMIDALKSKLIFSTHNLVSDTGFNKFDLIICRNVLIYFNKELQSQVLQNFYDSLNNQGFLALGSKETLMFSSISELMGEFHPQFKIWRKRA